MAVDPSNVLKDQPSLQESEALFLRQCLNLADLKQVLRHMPTKQDTIFFTTVDSRHGTQYKTAGRKSTGH